MPSDLRLGDCLDVMRSMPPESIDAVVTDPPYGLGFMGRAWDALPPGVDWAREVLRVLKPGGHVVAFGGQRTIHRLACALEDGGFEIRDQIGWVFWNGFPKSLDVSKAIDATDRTQKARDRALAFTAWMRASGITASQINAATGTNMGSHYLTDKEQPAVATADLFDLLRPLLPTVPDAIEQLVRSRTVESENMKRREVVGVECLGNTASYEGGFSGTVVRSNPATDAARQWNGWGTALKPAIEPAVLARKPFAGTVAANVLRYGVGALNIDGCRYANADPAWPAPTGGGHGGKRTESDGFATQAHPLGRWPANLYACPKASRRERERGTEGLSARAGHEAVDRAEGSAGAQNPRAGAGRTAAAVRNHHPTVKPVRLMRWLVRLVTPPGGVVLDPFLGSGTTGIAAVLEGVGFVGVEREPEYHAIAEARVRYAESGAWPAGPLFSPDEADDDDTDEQFVGAVQLGLFGEAA